MTSTDPSTSTVAQRSEPIWFGIEIERCPACLTAHLGGETCPRECIPHRGRRQAPASHAAAALVEDERWADQRLALERGFVRAVALA